MLRIESLKIRSLTKTMLQCSRIEINEGDFVAIVGPSGAGKSTLLNYIAGFIVQKKSKSGQLGAIKNLCAEGKIFFQGNDVSNLQPSKRDLAIVYQQDSIYPHMTVIENITFPLKNTNNTKESKLSLSIKLMETVMLDASKLNQRASSLSGGEQQRLALAKMFAKSAAVYLLDEPFSHLDPVLRDHLREALHSDEIAKIKIMVTHDWDDLKYASKIILITDFKSTRADSENILVFNMGEIKSFDVNQLDSEQQKQWIKSIRVHWK